MAFLKHNQLYFGLLLTQEAIIELLEKDYGIAFENKDNKQDVADQISELRGREFGPNECRVYSEDGCYIFGLKVDITPGDADFENPSLKHFQNIMSERIAGVRESCTGDNIEKYSSFIFPILD